MSAPLQRRIGSSGMTVKGLHELMIIVVDLPPANAEFCFDYFCCVT